MNDRPKTAEPAPPLGRAAAALLFASLAALAWTPWVPFPAVAPVLLVAFAARRIAWLRDRAAWTAVYAAAAVFALQPWSVAAASERLGAFLVALALGLLVGAALDGAAEGTRWAWVAPLALFAVWPSATGALGGLGVAILGALSGREARARAGGSRHRSPEAAVALAALAVAVALVAMPLGGAGGLRDLGTPAMPSTAPMEPEEPGAVDEGSGRRPTHGTARRSPLDLTSGLEASITAVLAAAVVLALAFAVTLRVVPRADRRPATWAELVPLGALALLAAVAALVLSQRAPPSPAGAGPGSTGAAGAGGVARVAPGDVPAERADRVPPDRGTGWTLVLTLAAVGAAGYVGWLAWRSRAAVPATAPPDAAPGAVSPTSAEATGRVRAAYRTFLVVAERGGLGRQESETPAELARRVGATLPAATGPAEALARLYEPVRYGGLADERGALEAERALGELESMLAPVSS